jgi:predicted CopG family antitoxin|tara:strand:+ start:2098 stop:2238 length:141 start_codon:yes stop_codon:yes gene_type:complete
MSTRTIKIDDVHYSMLKDIGKKWRMSPDELVMELIQETYASKAKRK